MRRAARGAGVCLVGLLALGCRGPTITVDGDDESDVETTQDTEGSSGTDTGDVFDPSECASWDPPAAVPAGTPPPEQDCAGDCPVFTEVGEAAGIATTQYVSTHPADFNCIFPKPSRSGLSPNQDCEPQWFTGGVTVGDVDNDGWPDVFLTRLAAPDHLFRNRGDGTFEDVAQQTGLGECSYSNGATFGDIDNDGDLDLLVTSVGDGRYYLWVNQLQETGELQFVEEALARGFAMQSGTLHSGESVTLGDYDRDGWLDVHVNEWLRIEQMPLPGEPDLEAHGARLLHNEGGGFFADVTTAMGVDLYGNDEDGIFAYSSAFGDFDGDGWQDLAVAVDFHHSRMFWNEGGQGFLDGTIEAKVNRESNAMGSTWADIDRDGALDWFVTSIAELDDECNEGEEPPCWAGSGNRMYRYAGAREYATVTDTAGVRDGAWAWGAAFFDADNDGAPDLAVANGWPGRDLNGGFYHADTPMRLWMNGGAGVMTEQGEARGVDDTGQGRGLVAFDYDRDGDLDLLVANHAGTPRLLRNDGGNTQPWLRVEVEGVQTNRDGRGAKVRVQAVEGGPWQIREVGVGSHFLGESELIQHFGLGPGAQTAFRVEVEWPLSGVVQGFDDVPAETSLTVVEGEP